MKILMIAPEMPPPGRNPTGTPAHILKLKSGLEVLGHHVTVVETTTRLRSRTTDSGSPRYGFLASIRRIRRGIVNGDWNIVHCHGHYAAVVALIATVGIARILVCELHGVYVPSSSGSLWRKIGSQLLARLEIIALRSVNVVVVQSQAMRRRVMSLGTIPEKIRVIYPGVNIDEFIKVRMCRMNNCDEPLSSRNIVYVGSTQRFQGLALFAAAMRLALRSDGKVRATLILSGDTDESLDDDALRLFDPNWSEIIRPTTNSELLRFLESAMAVIHLRPNVVDNINVQSKIGLYLASGVPIIASNVGDYADLFGNQPGIILCDPNPEAGARAIMTAAGLSCEERKLAVRKNLELAETYFNRDQNCVALSNLYKQMVSCR